MIPRLIRGGALRSTLDVANAQMTYLNDRHRIVSLGATEPAAVRQAVDAGFDVIDRNDTARLTDALNDADIVHLAAWNTPELYAWLASPLPPMRLVMTLHVAGEYPAQVATLDLLNFADWVIAATPHSLTLPSFREQLRARPDRVHVVLDSTLMPSNEIVAPPHTGVRIGYAGTVDFVKMHPRFVQLCADAAKPDTTFFVAGDGTAVKTLKRQAKEYPHVRFDFPGYLEHVLEFLASCDIFGYPLARYTYAASELILQQAMWLGVPPVILAVGGLPYLVQHQETGMVARDETEYSEMLRQLADDADERRRLGANARAFARAHFGADRVASDVHQLYDMAMQHSKRERQYTPQFASARFPGAAALICALGEWGGPYQTSLAVSDRAQARAAEFQIANASPLESAAGAGGILDYRMHYSADPLLRMWAGLTLGTQKRYALAAAEFVAARQLGLGADRVEGYLERVMAHQTPFEDSYNAG